LKTHQLFFLLSTLLATAASAGAKANYFVSVYLTNPSYGFAGGTIAAAQNSTDTRQSIVCNVNVNLSTGTRTLTCQAVDATGAVGWCTLNSPPQSVVDMVLSLNDTSYLGFYWDKATSVCTQIFVERNSMQVPRGGTTSLATSDTAAPAGVSPMEQARERR
jgi:hypothetical protein